MNKHSGASLRSKIFLSMSFIATGLMTLLMLASSILYFNYFLDSTSKYSLAQLDYISRQLNYYMESVSNYSLALITDNTVQKGLHTYNSNPDSFTALDKMHMKSSISHTIQSTPFIHSVTFYSKNKNLVSTTEYYPAKNTAIFPDTSPLWFLQQKNSNVKRDQLLYVLSMVQPVYSTASGSLLGYIEISIPDTALTSIYVSNTDKNLHIYMTDDKGVIKSSDGSLPVESVYKEFTTKTRSISYQNVTFTHYLPELDWYIISNISFSAFFYPLVPALFMTVLAAVFCVIICFIISRKLSRTITNPLYTLIDHTQKIKEGDWSTIDTNVSDRDVALLFCEFNSMLLAQEKLKNNLIETNRLKNKLSLDLIQEQVNPHFLYNTLDNILSLAELEEKQALVDIVMSLSTFYRVALSSGRFQITVGDELEITTAYLHIMQIRYFHKFEYTITCPEELKNYSCIKLLLQPIVENSIYHGIKEISSFGHLKILVEEKDADIRITVQDNGVGFTQETYEKIWESSTHFGVKNIHQRIQLYYGQEYGLTMESPLKNGCITTITIPKKEVDANAYNHIDCR